MTLTQVFLAAAVIGLATAVSLQLDPLAVVTQELEDFAANQTEILAEHLAQVNGYLANHTRVLAHLAQFLSGQRLRECLADPSQC